MTILRRTTQLVIAVGALGMGVLLLLEVTGVIGGRWRSWAADAYRTSLAPESATWQLVLAGIGLAVVAVVCIAAQLVPTPKGNSRMLEAGSSHDGVTNVAGRAALRAVEYELRQIDGVTASSAVMPSAKKIHAVVRVDDRADLESVENEARRRLDTPFWIDLGLPDVAVALTAEFDPKPPRVR